MDILGNLNGLFLGENLQTWILVSVGAIALCGFYGAPIFLWTILGFALIFGFNAPSWVFLGFLGVSILFNFRMLRQIVLSSAVMKIMTALKIIPKISETEKTALNAGVVWVEADLFSGQPNFKKIMSEPYPDLTPEEKAFMDGPLNKLCDLIDDWELWKTRELSDEVLNFIKKEKFLGMIIPKQYGGLEFSALAHSEVIQRLASRSLATSITVMVPNSLGPAELLIHYGTEDQKNYYLPRLASGEEVPCFALTEPTAGSDAGSLTASGTLFKEGDKLKIKLNWNKRYITLAGISTVLGLAFRLKDPDNLLGKGEDVGITCALVPSNTPGVDTSRRHDPMGVPFYNCPTTGTDVVVDASQIVGGIEGAGKGWKMLMESLAAGRGISLPAQSVGGAKLCTRVVSNYATIRKQFGVSLDKFEGIAQPMAHIAGFTYLMEAFRKFTLGALDKGIKPPVVTAIAKYNATELGRKVGIDAMDIVGGAGISRGERNLLAHPYIATPIGITVEGANILTRTLIIFGQGAMRAHPFAFKEVDALEKNDLKAFDRAFWGHVGHVFKNVFRSILLSVSRGWLTPHFHGGRVSRYYRRLSWVSASFAIMSDIAMASLGGALKQKEMLTGRFADILSWMYIGSSVLRRFKAEGSKKEDLPFVHFTMNHALFEIQKAFDGIFANITVPGLTWLFRGPIRWWSNLNALAGECSDKHIHKISGMVSQPGEQRDRLTDGIFISANTEDALGRLENAFKLIKKAEPIEKKIKKAVRAKTLPKLKGLELVRKAFEANVITSDERDLLLNVEEARNDAIQVDSFTKEEYLGHSSYNKAS